MAMCETHPFSPISALGCVLCHGVELAHADRTKPAQEGPARKKRRRTAELIDETPDFREAEVIVGDPFAGRMSYRVDPSYFD